MKHHYIYPRIFVLFILFLGMVSFQAWAQGEKVKTIDVSLKITDEAGEALPEALVVVGEGLMHLDTGQDGMVHFVSRQNEILTISKKGYEKKVISVSRLPENKTVKLKEAILYKTPEDLIPLPYSYNYKRNTTGSYYTLNTSKLEKYPSNDIRNVFVGLVPGLQVNEMEGAIGLHPEEIYGSYNIQEKIELRMRGQKPMYLIDGIPVHITEMPLDPQEIESVTIIKDIIGKAMFGSEAANGIVSIQTKRGSKNERVLTVDAEAGYSFTDRFPEWVSGADYARLNNQARLNSGMNAIYSDEQIRGYERNDPYDKVTPSIDFREIMLKNSKPYYRANVSSSGGTDVVQYFAYLGYSGEGDIYKAGPTSNYNRINARSNIDVNITKAIKLRFDFFAGLSLRKSPNYGSSLDLYEFNSVINDITYIPPTAFPIYADFDKDTGLPWYGVHPNYKTNPIGNLESNGHYTENGRSGAANVTLDLDLSSLVKGLVSKTYVGFNIINLTRIGKAETYTGYITTPELIVDGNGDPILDANGNKQYDIKMTKSFDGSSKSDLSNMYYYYTQLWVGRQMFTYNRSFGLHDVQSSLAYSISKYLRRFSEEPRRQQNVSWSAMYTYNNKYSLQGVLAYNGSSSFLSGKRYKLFPSVGASWIISEENFMKGSSGWLDFLKLRAEYGTIGYDFLLNNNIQYMYADRWTAGSGGSVFGPHTSNRWFGSTIDSNGSYQTTYNRIGNPNLTWETRREFSVGIDATLLNHRLSVEATYYNIFRDDVVVQISNSLPYVAGYLANPYYNYPQYRYNGMELGLQYSDKIGRDFRFSVGGNAAWMTSEIVRYDELPYRWDYQRATGKSLDSYWGLEYTGKFESDEEAMLIPQLFDETLSKGDLKYADLNGDGVVDSNDRKEIGNVEPRLIYGININLGYKRFDLTVIGNGHAFYDVPFTSSYFQNGWEDNTYSAFVRDNIGGDYPKLSYNRINNNFQESAFWLRNGNFFKIQNVELAYNIRLSATNGMKLRGARVFVRGANLLTISGIKDVDPESVSSGLYSNGRGRYPLFRTFTAGFKLIF